MNSEHVMVFITAVSAEEAGRIADALVSEKLAACANILGGVSSVYWWRGKKESANEVLLTAKTRIGLLDSLIARVKNLHSYEVPEIVALPIAGGSADYLQWIDDSLK